MSNGDPNAPPPFLPPLPPPPRPRRQPRRFRFRRGRLVPIRRRPRPEDRPDVAFLPQPIPGVTTPPSRIFIPDAPVAPGPTIGAILSRVGFPAALGSIAIILAERIGGVIQDAQFRRLEEEAEAEIRMTRGRIKIRERDLRVETLPEAAGDLRVPPGGREPGLSDIPQFPFPDPFEEPLGDDPLPDIRPPIPLIITPVEFPAAPAPEPQTPAPVEIPAPEAPPTLPGPETKPAPATRPGTPTSPAPGPSPSPFPPPRPSAPPRTSPFAVPFSVPFDKPSADPQRRLSPGEPTPTPTDVPAPDLTLFEQPGVPLQQPTRDRRCPPCEEEELEPRTECFKKLVIEKTLPDQDETFNWIEVDCFTGKEIG